MKFWNRFLSIFLSLILVVGLAPTSQAASNPFADVKPTDYYYDAVLWAVEHGVTSGTSATAFSPNALCTRGQVVTFLWRSSGNPEPKSYECPFVDVNAGSYYYEAVLWAVENNITSGTTTTTFSPSASCTRGQVVTFLHRAQGTPTPSFSSTSFADLQTDSYYYNAVLWAVDKSITSGTSATTFSPSKACTRGQIVTFLYRAIHGTNHSESDYDSFGKAVSALVKENPIVNWSAAAAADNDYYSRRLIIQSSVPIDFSEFHPSDVVAGPDNLYMVQFATSVDTENAFRVLANMAEVIYVEPDGYFGEGENQEVVSEARSWGVKTLGADKLASYVKGTTNNTITVAVVDTGVSAHSFIGGRLLGGGYDFVDNDTTPTDMHYHGTHVAGTIVDCTPGINVNVLPVRVLNEKGNGYSSAVGSGIRYAADHGAKVINLSLGGGHSNYIDSAVQYAVSKGVCVVVAAGNEYGNTANQCPAHISSAITVGAVDSNLRKAAFSNTGSSLDVVCPGVGIASCVPGGGYKTLDGTSMATPHASASVAMLRLLYPSSSPAGIEKMLRDHCKDLGDRGWDTSYGAGLPDLTQFVSVLPTGISLNTRSLSLSVGGSATLTATVSPSDAADKSVIWSSSNPAVASVSGIGVVSAQSVGTATITAKTTNGISATCTVTVSSVTIRSISVTSAPSKSYYYIGDTLDTTGLRLTLTYTDGSTSSVSSGFTCTPTTLDSTGSQIITVNYDNLSSSFAVTVAEPRVYFSSSSEVVNKNCWDSYWDLSRGVPLWKLDLPNITTSPGGPVSWSVVSGEAYMGSGYIAAQKPGKIIARATYTYNGFSCSADYTVTLNIYKTTTAVNYLRSGPSRDYGTVTSVPNGATVWITDVVWDVSRQPAHEYYIWGKTTYNGRDGWIVIS